MNFLKKVCGLFRYKTLDQIRHSKAWVDIIRIRKNTDFSEPNDADWILSYAQNRFERTSKSLEYIENKADSLLRYMGVGTVLIFALNSTFKDIPQISQRMFFVGVLLWLFSILFALVARKPTEIPTPASTKFIFMRKDKYGYEDSMKARLSLCVELGSVGHLIRGKEKSRMLTKAYMCLIIALVFFVASFFLSNTCIF